MISYITYDLISTIRMVGLIENIKGLIKQSMNKLKTKVYAHGKMLGPIFQWKSFSSLPFAIALLPLPHVLRETKNETGNRLLAATVWQWSEYLKMEFGISKFAIVSRHRGKKIGREGIKLPYGKEIYEADSRGNKYLGVL